MRALLVIVLVGFCAACAGRDAHPVSTVQPQDQYSDCAMIRAEIEVNNARAQKLASENGWKIAQNVVAGTVGLVFWPLLFATDVKAAAYQEATALQSRQEYLAKLAQQRCSQANAAPTQ